ncbi:hypothetical protein Tco_1217391 [Tanacetum coccineum]
MNILKVLKDKIVKLLMGPKEKIDPKGKGKKNIKEEDESKSESDGISHLRRSFKHLESDEEQGIEADRLLLKAFKNKKEKQFTIEERAKFQFEEGLVQALYEKIRGLMNIFISYWSAEDERLIKKMNEKGVDLRLKWSVIKEKFQEETPDEEKEVEYSREYVTENILSKNRKTEYFKHEKPEGFDRILWEICMV